MPFCKKDYKSRRYGPRVAIDPDLVGQIDGFRGQKSRPDFVRQALMYYFELLKKQAIEGK